MAGERDRLLRQVGDVDVGHPLVDLVAQLDVDPVAPQPRLEVRHVPVEGAVAAASGLVRKVRVDAI